MKNDDTKRLILARRARFVAAALSGVSVAAACGGSTTEKNPQPCLSIQADGGGGDASDDAEPQVCLSPILQDSGSDGGPKDADSDADPQPCLSPPIGDQ